MTDKQVDNGVNVEALLGAREALTETPEGAKFTWRAKCDWVHGTYSQTTVEGFFGIGEEQQHRTKFSFDADHPEVFASEDRGATPVEIVLAGGGVERSIMIRGMTAGYTLFLIDGRPVQGNDAFGLNGSQAGTPITTASALADVTAATAMIEDMRTERHTASTPYTPSPLP